MDELKIIWTNIAVKQRNHIFNYWNLRNKSKNYSIRLNNLIYNKIDLLKNNPTSGIEIENENCRNLHFEKYSLIYKISNDSIFILAFWDNRQNPKKLKKLLGL